MSQNTIFIPADVFQQVMEHLETLHYLKSSGDTFDFNNDGDEADAEDIKILLEKLAALPTLLNQKPCA